MFLIAFPKIPVCSQDANKQLSEGTCVIDCPSNILELILLMLTFISLVSISSLLLLYLQNNLDKKIITLLSDFRPVLFSFAVGLFARHCTQYIHLAWKQTKYFALGISSCLILCQNVIRSADKILEKKQQHPIR